MRAWGRGEQRFLSVGGHRGLVQIRDTALTAVVSRSTRQRRVAAASPWAQPSVGLAQDFLAFWDFLGRGRTTRTGHGA